MLGSRGANVLAVSVGVKQLEIDSQRYLPYFVDAFDEAVEAAQAVELFASEAGRTDHRVVAAGGGTVGDIGERVGGGGRQNLSEQPIEAFVRNHYRGDTAPACPRPQPAQGQPVRYLDGIGRQVGEHVCDRPQARYAISAREGQCPGGDGDAAHSRGQHPVAAFSSGNDEGDVVAAADVPGAEFVDGGAQSPDLGP